MQEIREEGGTGMTREEAIKHIKAMCQMLLGADNKPISDTYYALEMAISALSAEPCEDAISRQAVIYGLAVIAKAKARSDAQKSLMGRSMFFVEHMPPVQPIRPRGHWIECEDEVKVYCSECKEKSDYPTNYCQNCGADMREETNHE